jgi:hypothetical protein
MTDWLARILPVPGRAAIELIAAISQQARSSIRRHARSRGRRLPGLVLTTLGLMMGFASPASGSDSRRYAMWADASALTVAPGRLEVSILADGAYGLNRSLELRLQPLAFFVLPHLEGKLRLVAADRFQVSSVHRISYPTLFLELVSREGTGGLLPPDNKPPTALLLDNGLIASVELWRLSWLSLRVDACVAPRTSEPTTTLDFPFLYQRFAALEGTLVPRGAASLSGRLLSVVDYSMLLRHYLVGFAADKHSSIPHGATATEYSASLSWRPALGHRVTGGATLSVADLPVGRRQHLLPYIDYGFEL